MFFTIGRRRWATITESPRRGSSRSGRTRLGSQKDGLPSCPWGARSGVQGHQLAQGRGSLVAALQIESDMDSKTHHLVLLAALSLSCAMLALAMDHAVFGSVFSALSAVAVIGAAGPRARR